MLRKAGRRYIRRRACGRRSIGGAAEHGAIKRQAFHAKRRPVAPAPGRKVERKGLTIRHRGPRKSLRKNAGTNASAGNGVAQSSGPCRSESRWRNQAGICAEAPRGCSPSKKCESALYRPPVKPRLSCRVILSRRRIRTRVANLVQGDVLRSLETSPCEGEGVQQDGQEAVGFRRRPLGTCDTRLRDTPASPASV